MTKPKGPNEFQKAQQMKVEERILNQCKLCSGIAKQPLAKRKVFLEALFDQAIEGSTIKSVLEGWNVFTSVENIQKHRNGNKAYLTHLTRLKELAK